VEKNVDVLVVGAGPTGLTLGVEMLRRGVGVRIVDRADRPHPHSKAIVLWPRALEVFRRIGVVEEILDRALPLPAANYYSDDRLVARMAFDTLPGSRFGSPVCLPQEETEAVLAKAFRDLGGEVEFGVSLTWLRQDATGVDALLDERGTATETRVPWLVGCDGAHSAVREQAGISFEGATYQQTFLLADGRCETGLAHDEAHYFMTSTGVLVVVGLPGGGYRVFASVAPGTDVEDPEALLQQVADSRCAVPLRLVGEQRTGVFQVHRRMADRFRAGRVLLAGDAAHIHSPAGGQGLNTAIEDAHTLAWRLALPDNDVELDAWERERRQVAAAVVADTDRQTKLWMLRGWRGRTRDAVLALGGRSGVLGRVLPRRMAQLHHVHPGGGRPIGRFVPGQRVPDLALGGPGPVYVHDLLAEGRAVRLVLASDSRSSRDRQAVSSLVAAPPRGSDQVLVVRDADQVPAGTAPNTRVIVDTTGDAHRRLGFSGPLAVLLRPDGVVDHVHRADLQPA
jgi:2-polyprenyl-6-methoxyphenol hydroxylase-like FAD-dependent oxidoreductase